MSSPLELYLRALDGFTAVVERAPADGWDTRSPCPEWTARQLVGHVIDAGRQVTAMLSRQGLKPPVTDVTDLDLLAGSDPAVNWRRSRQDTVAALANVDLDVAVTTTLDIHTVGDVLATVVIEPLVHAWDLAVVSGQQVQLDAEAAQVTLPAVNVLGGRLAVTGMYQPPIPVLPTASPQDQLLAALGRLPNSSRLPNSN
jgi:uncharacterized protein (TIGR03086 family)